jgi:hypothetical protein
MLMTPKYETAENPHDPSSYFLPDAESKDLVRQQQLANLKTKFQYYAMKVWPYINRAISATLYFIIRLVKTFVSMVMEQIKSKG